ncbi:MAG TPA: hypothetical protein VGR02_06095 [Thermoanaerobaculia bacterium]|jgi:hypothetical protein|nr:hypothetical protein [Thermoanaerobaculia bacterium]
MRHTGSRPAGRIRRGLLAISAAAVMMMGMTALGDERAPLRVRLATSAGEYRLGQPIGLEVRLENVSNDVVTVFGSLRWGYAGGLVLHVTDAAGKDVQPKALDDDMIPPSVFKRADAFVTLQKRHSLGTTRADGTADLFPRAGTYTIWVDYTSPVPASLGRGAHFRSRESGTLHSNKVTVRIKEQR